MRYREFFIEARKNPELSLDTRSPTEQQALKYINQLPTSELSTYGVRVGEHPMLTINPHYQDSAPAGIYYFPAAYFAKEIVKAPDDREAGFYLGDSSFYVIHVFKFDPTNILVINDVTEEDYSRAVLWFKEHYSQYLNGSNKKEFQHPGQRLLWMFKNVAARMTDSHSQMLCNKLIRKYGYTGVFDRGEGLIHGSEPTQGVIVDPTIIKSVKLFKKNSEKRRHNITYLVWMAEKNHERYPPNIEKYIIRSGSEYQPGTTVIYLNLFGLQEPAVEPKLAKEFFRKDKGSRINDELNDYFSRHYPNDTVENTCKRILGIQ